MTTTEARQPERQVLHVTLGEDCRAELIITGVPTIPALVRLLAAVALLGTAEEQRAYEEGIADATKRGAA